MSNEISYYIYHLLAWTLFFVFKLYRFSLVRILIAPLGYLSGTRNDEIATAKVLGILAIIGHSILIILMLIYS